MALASLIVAVPPAGAGSSRANGFAASMTVTTSPRTAGAHGVRLRLTLRYEMQCGYAGAGLLVVTFPRVVKLPKRFPAGAVLLAGKRIAATVEHRQVTVRVPPHKGVLCNVMAPGSLTLAFTPAAKLANPARAGAYRFRAAHSGRAFTSRLAIKPAG